MQVLYKIYSIAFILLLLFVGCSDSVNRNELDLLKPSPPNVLELKVTKIESSGQTCPSINIDFTIPLATWVRLEMKNATGYTVKVLYDDYMEAGAHYVSWDGTNEDNEKVNNGIYITYIASGPYVAWYPAFYCTVYCEE